MDGSLFDALSRAMISGHPRRGLVQILAALTLAGPLAGAGTGDTAARRRKGKKKRRRKRDTDATPSPIGPCARNCTQRICGDDGCGGSCGSCDNAALPHCCAGLCTDYQSDPAHCAACGTACGAGEACINGSCTPTCAPACSGATPVCCPSGCTNTAVDRRNCGTCGRVCAESEYCRNGGCVEVGVDCPATGGCPTGCGGDTTCQCARTQSGNHPACVIDDTIGETCCTHQECRGLGYGANSICLTVGSCSASGACSAGSPGVCTWPCGQGSACLPPGQGCIFDRNCCSNNCAGDFCRYPASVCRLQGASCSAKKQCCSGDCVSGNCAGVVGP